MLNKIIVYKNFKPSGFSRRFDDNYGHGLVEKDSIVKILIKEEIPVNSTCVEKHNQKVKTIPNYSFRTIASIP